MHYDRVDLLAYLEQNAELVDLDAVASHLAICTSCTTTLNELAAFEALLQRVVLDDAARDVANMPPLGGATLYREEDIRRARERRDADDTYNTLSMLARGAWAAYLDKLPFRRTEGLVERIITAAIVELDRNTEEALALLDAAESLLPSLDARAALHLGADIEKNRANAQRELGAYPEALAAAERALVIAESWPGGGFDYAQSLYTRGTVYFKMGRYDAALADALHSGKRFAEFRAIQRVIHARNLEAVVRTEQGEVAEALRVYRLIRPQAEQIGDLGMVARSTANIAVALFRLGELAEARTYAYDAKTQYTTLSIEGEVVRTDWILAAITFREGGREEGLVAQEKAAAAFEARNMLADAAFVRLHMVGDLLTIGAWQEAARLARVAAETFARSGVRLHQMEAMAYLREAVEQQSATVGLVEYVRDYIAADDPARPFTPVSVS